MYNVQMYNTGMNFLNRQNESARLDALMSRRAAGLVALWGRRRVGKSRLLTEWCRRWQGLYTVADQSAAAVQRRYFAEAIEPVLPGFSESSYTDWRSLFRRLSRDARSAGWRGPLVIDELPYWVMSDNALPSILQNWIDEEARSHGILCIVAGSSQRMMQGLLLHAAAPLYGRALELMEIQPISAGWIGEALGMDSPIRQIEAFSVWGGIPRYWELAAPYNSDLDEAVDTLVLHPQGALHREPDRLLQEEFPSAVALRPLLDVMGGGAHRLSEIAARLAQPVTALSRPLTRLIELGLVVRETPYGEAEKSTKRSLYKIADPFFRFWFQVVAPRRALLAQASKEVRLALWRAQKERLCGMAWEQLCRAYVGRNAHPLKALLGSPDDAWKPAMRWWRGQEPEFDVVAGCLSGRSLLIGEAKWSSRAFHAVEINRITESLKLKKVPASLQGECQYVAFLPSVTKHAEGGGITIVTADHVLETRE